MYQGKVYNYQCKEQDLQEQEDTIGEDIAQEQEGGEHSIDDGASSHDFFMSPLSVGGTQSTTTTMHGVAHDFTNQSLSFTPFK